MFSAGVWPNGWHDSSIFSGTHTVTTYVEETSATGVALVEVYEVP